MGGCWQVLEFVGTSFDVLDDRSDVTILKRLCHLFFFSRTRLDRVCGIDCIRARSPIVTHALAPGILLTMNCALSVLAVLISFVNFRNTARDDSRGMQTGPLVSSFVDGVFRTRITCQIQATG